MQIFDIVLLPVGEQIVRERRSPIIRDTYFSSKLTLFIINDRTYILGAYLESKNRKQNEPIERMYLAQAPFLRLSNPGRFFFGDFKHSRAFAWNCYGERPRKSRVSYRVADTST